ncbi:CocE/NonD family hydrolase [Sinorhizobium alkalisoli]|uniref:Peptidase n=1 Tax=Sinorhizobium alkalisoli TaxID=1752398 RepID=A0A1E3V4S9_9HYPH|nr:CocE/NonD family hydrolase [Sinorhizobium alkalisoli]MCA1490928.1 CocE/NonD family hydrolase [Ensifer sp. NBAIM29]MCG5483788.1 CocE/NonD family hydrolase [Sinorhizobium meliloti]ODR88161.1 peptidase [Sinorhizobium alkalisoli]QFI67119.1 glutaryl 7-ACA acylase [Sinorhizobium alkalisoli]
MTDRNFTVIENEWIALKDGTRLASRIWMPEGTEQNPVPAVLEFLPYRKRDGTSARDESTYPGFAAAGIAGVRVDIRGSGESEGVIDGEYTPRELSDASEIIEWIAAQPWSNGKVGMMGISWGGFNALQVAALKPPALKAVISIASTVDRYNDDIHYKNGCHLSAQLSWAATMLAYQSRSPDPELVGERWKEMWLERLENEPFFLEEWLEHQRRDDFWRHGSICEDFDGFPVPALVIAGWADGYRNTPIKAIEGLGDRAKALIGPWVHKYPHFAWPKPRADFLSEAIRWWNRWLRNERNDAEQLPQMRAYILDGPRPALRRDEDAGRWIAKDVWTAPEMRSFGIARDGSLASGRSREGIGDVYLRSPLDTGTAAGEYFTLKPDAELAGDQRIDDAGSLTFETHPLLEAEDYLGQPVLSLDVSCAAATANLIARLVDVHPDGTATRVSFGVLNLAHRNGNAKPVPMEKNHRTRITLVLDACGYRFRAGHRIRLSLSTSYWPMILPSPSDPGLTVDTESLSLSLPLLGDHREIVVPQPANPNPLPHYIAHSQPQTRRTVERDMTRGVTHYTIYEDTGLVEHPDTGNATQDIRCEIWSIAPDDPHSVTGVSTWTCTARRDGRSLKTISKSRLSCTGSEWITSAKVEAFEEETKIFEKTFEKRIRRDLM